jgi:hypothetical protein
LRGASNRVRAHDFAAEGREEQDGRDPRLQMTNNRPDAVRAPRHAACERSLTSRLGGKVAAKGRPTCGFNRYEEESMDSIRTAARRRGLRMAAQVAAITGFVAAGAAFSQAAELPQPSMGSDSAGAGQPMAGSEGSSMADRVAEAVTVRNVKSCGCAPCWGPPAPPSMRAELFGFVEEMEEQPS